MLAMQAAPDLPPFAAPDGDALRSIEESVKALDARIAAVLEQWGRARARSRNGERLWRRLGRLLAEKARCMDSAMEVESMTMADLGAKARMAKAAMLYDIEGNIVGMHEGLMLSIMEDLIRLD